MWWNDYRDKGFDQPLKTERQKQGKGTCEMQEFAGWGESFHRPPKSGSGWLRQLAHLMTGTKVK